MSGSAASAEPTDPRYRWKMLGVVVLGTLLSALNASTVNVCLPSMMASFGASVDDIQWVVTAYMLGFSTLMPLTVWLRDRLGHRTLYILSLVVFTGGSVLCGVAWSLPVLLLARVVQAFGGGALTPTAMAMIAEAFPPAERGRALGIWGVGMIVGPAIGPTLGGYLTEAFGWRAIFDVNVPFALVGLLTAVSILRHDRPPTAVRRPFDLAGFVLLSAFLVALLLGLSKGNVEGWSSRYVLTCWAVAGFSFAGFLLVESVVEHGILDLGLLRHGQLTIALVVTAVRSVALYGGTFLLPVFLQTHMGLDEIRTGELLLPGAVVLGAMMPFSGRLADRIGARLPTVAGLLATATFMFMYRELDSVTSTWGILAPMLIRGIGIGLNLHAGDDGGDERRPDLERRHGLVDAEPRPAGRGLGGHRGARVRPRHPDRLPSRPRRRVAPGVLRGVERDRLGRRHAPARARLRPRRRPARDGCDDGAPRRRDRVGRGVRRRVLRRGPHRAVRDRSGALPRLARPRPAQGGPRARPRRLTRAFASLRRGGPPHLRVSSSAVTNRGAMSTGTRREPVEHALHLRPDHAEPLEERLRRRAVAPAPRSSSARG